MYPSRPTGEELAARVPFAGRPAGQGISAGHEMRFGRVRRMPRLGCRPPASGMAAASLGQEAWRPGRSSPIGGARQFLPGIRGNRLPELTFGNEATFCYGFGKAMS